MRIREFDERKDLNQLRECAIELQDFERSIDPRKPTGEGYVDAYIPQMRERCKKCHGKIFVAEGDGEIAGYVTILTKVRSEGVEDGDLEYGLVSDLVILKRFKIVFGMSRIRKKSFHLAMKMSCRPFQCMKVS